MNSSLQRHYAPHNSCFGCGPSNEQGLQLQSFVDGDSVIAKWQAKDHHEAFPGMLNGGIIGTLLDCHSNWAAAYYLMQQNEVEIPPCTVTAYYNVSLKQPTPSHGILHLEAKKFSIQEDRAVIKAQLFFEDKLCALCEGLFVAVKPGHPAYRRW